MKAVAEGVLGKKWVGETRKRQTCWNDELKRAIKEKTTFFIIASLQNCYKGNDISA